jgi:hypothetical protein
LITPPRTGPRTELRIKTTDVTATYVPHWSEGTISGFMTVTMA